MGSRLRLLAVSALLAVPTSVSAGDVHQSATIVQMGVGNAAFVLQIGHSELDVGGALVGGDMVNFEEGAISLLVGEGGLLAWTIIGDAINSNTLLDD